MVSRAFGSRGPQVPHLLRGAGGLAGEIQDLRADIESAFKVTEGAVDGSLLKILMDEIVPPAGGVDTVSVGFQVTDAGGNPVEAVVRVEYSIFTDADFINLSSTSLLDSEIAGEVLLFSGGAAVVKTNASGKFTCTLTNSNDETNYIACRTFYGERALGCSDTKTVEFIP